MLLDEKDNSDQFDNSLNENEFEELNDEIIKVIRGETSFDEEKTDKNLIVLENRSSHEQNSENIMINENDNITLINENLDINDKNEKKKDDIYKDKKINDIYNSNNLKNSYQKQENNYNELNNYSNNINNEEKKQFNNNNINLNFNNNINNSYLFNNMNNNFLKSNNESYFNNNLKVNNENNESEIKSNRSNNNNSLNFLTNTNNDLYQTNNFYNSTGSNESINNKNNLNYYGELNSNIKNKSINNINFDKKSDTININQIFTPSLSSDKEGLIKQYDFFCQNHNVYNNTLFNNYNEINGNNFITNYININIPLVSINFNQLFSNNKNNLNLNQYNNLNSINNNNYFFQNNFDGENLSLINNKNKINDDIFLNKFINNKEKYKKNNNKFFDTFSNKDANDINIFNKIKNNINNNPNFVQSKNDNSKLNMININNQGKTGYLYKRKIFNPIPDSEKEKNKINILDIIQCKDLRTTLMIKNIPNKYTISSFLEEINVNFKDTYDIFYLPIDYINKCNLGFAFINFVEPLHIILFYELYKGKKWKRFNSDKICELLYGKYQGKNELISHFERGKVLLFNSKDKRPLILQTPDPLPKINLPLNYFNLFNKLYPDISYEIKEYNDNKNNNKNYIKSLQKVFTINGNFRKN